MNLSNHVNRVYCDFIDHASSRWVGLIAELLDALKGCTSCQFNYMLDKSVKKRAAVLDGGISSGYDTKLNYGDLQVTIIVQSHYSFSSDIDLSRGVAEFLM